MAWAVCPYLNKEYLLPQELPSPDEWSGVFELPSDNISPLVYFKREVSVRLNPVREGRVHDRFRGGTDGDRFF